MRGSTRDSLFIASYLTSSHHKEGETNVKNGLNRLMLLGLISNNMADVWLHATIAVVALWLGFMAKDQAN